MSVRDETVKPRVRRGRLSHRLHRADMAVRDETVKPGGLSVGFKELLAFAVALVILVGGIVGGMQWAVSSMQWVVTSTVAPLLGSIDALRQDVRALDSRVHTLAETVPTEIGGLRSDMSQEFKAVRGEIVNVREDIAALSERLTRVETLLEQRTGQAGAASTPATETE